MYQVINN